jgi:hypothetical protein
MAQYYEGDEDLTEDERKERRNERVNAAEQSRLVRRQFSNTQIQEMANDIREKFSDPNGGTDSAKELYQTWDGLWYDNRGDFTQLTAELRSQPVVNNTGNTIQGDDFVLLLTPVMPAATGGFKRKSRKHSKSKRRTRRMKRTRRN